VVLPCLTVGRLRDHTGENTNPRAKRDFLPVKEDVAPSSRLGPPRVFGHRNHARDNPPYLPSLAVAAVESLQFPLPRDHQEGTTSPPPSTGLAVANTTALHM
jgi:hypothetical protein